MVVMANRLYRSHFFLAGALLLGACGSSQTANEANFTQVLNVDFAARPECIWIPTQAHRTEQQEDFPVYVLGTQTPPSIQPFVDTGLMTAGVDETTAVFN